MFVVFNLVPSTSASDSSTESTNLRSILRPHVHLQTPYHRPHQETQPPRSRPINVPLREAHEAAGKYITHTVHIIETTQYNLDTGHFFYTSFLKHTQRSRIQIQSESFLRAPEARKN